MDDETRSRWITTHIFPCEGEVRRWLRQHVRTLQAADVEDLLQEAYARIWAADFTQITNARGYFYTIVRNLLLEQARRARIVPMERMGEIETLRSVSDEPGPERRASAREELEFVLRVIAALPAKCRRVFEMRTFEGCSRGQIAGRLGISARTVAKHLEKAYGRVGEAMVQEPASSDSAQFQTRNRRHDLPD